MPTKPRPAFERMMDKVVKDAETGCWLFTGALKPNGYGCVFLYKDPLTKKSKMDQAHRVSWDGHVGPIPQGMRVLHTCDVPACVNPDHLWLGTHFDNMRDMVTKGRSSRGSRHGGAVLTEEGARYIKRSVAQTVDRLAEELGVDTQTVRFVAEGRTWRHINYR